MANIEYHNIANPIKVSKEDRIWVKSSNEWDMDHQCDYIYYTGPSYSKYTSYTTCVLNFNHKGEHKDYMESYDREAGEA